MWEHMFLDGNVFLIPEQINISRAGSACLQESFHQKSWKKELSQIAHELLGGTIELVAQWVEVWSDGRKATLLDFYLDLCNEQMRLGR
jgi:hypothetical protein